MLILLFKNVLKISNFENGTKTNKKSKRKQQKNPSISFCVCAFTREENISIIKIAYLMLNFLNLKSLLSNLFFVVASSLSILWTFSHFEAQKIWTEFFCFSLFLFKDAITINGPDNLIFTKQSIICKKCRETTKQVHQFLNCLLFRKKFCYH